MNGSPGAEARPAAGRMASLLRVGVPPTLVALLIILIWYGVTYLVLEPDRRFLLPPPHGVIQEGLLNGETLAEILGGLYQTTMVAFLGLAIAFALGFSMALVMSQAKWIERSLYPWAVVSQTVPILALVPLLGFWFGFGLMSRVTVCVIIALFPIVINSLTGLQGVEPKLHDLLTLHGAGRWVRAIKLQIPAARPLIFTGLRTSAGLSVIGAIVGDFFFGRGRPGLGDPPGSLQPPPEERGAAGRGDRGLPARRGGLLDIRSDRTARGRPLGPVMGRRAAPEQLMVCLPNT